MTSGSSSIAGPADGDAAVVRFSTADYAPRERLDAWREIYGRTLQKLDVEPLSTEPLHTEATLRRMPGLAVNVVRRSAVIHNRRREFVSHDDVGITVGLTSNFEANQFGRTLTMSRGEAIVLTGAEPAFCARLTASTFTSGRPCGPWPRSLPGWMTRMVERSPRIRRRCGF